MGRQGLVFDAQPLLAFINGEPSSETVRAILADATMGRRAILMTVVNVAETMYIAERRGGPGASHATLDLVQQLPLRLIEVDLELAARAAYFKARGGISISDCFAAALAHRESLPVLTADREFERVSDLVEVIWLS